MAFHRPRELERLLNGLRSPALRIVVVNVEDDPAIAAVAKDVSVYPLPGNPGYAAAVNTGVRALDGSTDAIVFMNDDIEASAGDVLSLADRVLSGATDVALPLVVDARGHPELGTRAPLKLARRMLLRGMPIPHEPIDVDAGWAVMVAARRPVLNDVPLPEDYFMYWEEFDWFYRLREQRCRIQLDPGVRIRHAGGLGDVRPEKSRLLARNAVRCVRRTRGGWAAARAWPVVVLWQLRQVLVSLFHGRHQELSAHAAGAREAAAAWREVLSGGELNSGSRLRRALRHHAALRRPGWQILDRLAQLRGLSLAATGEALQLKRRIRATSNAAAQAALAFPQADCPHLSVIVPVFNNWSLTRRCLGSIALQEFDETFEVILVDDASTDRTALDASSIPGLRMTRNAVNLGFTRSANAGWRCARGGQVLFLNNDTVLMPGALKALTSAIRDPGIGAVGAKLLFPSGRLQEAGGLIWNDGTGWNIGRGQRVTAPAFCFRRDVDYCSGAALLVRRAVLEALGGFDENFAPAYCEDSDLCFQIRRLGLRVVMEPTAWVVHWEGMTHGTEVRRPIEGARSKDVQAINQRKFADKWRDELLGHRAPPEIGPSAEVLGSLARPGPRVLILDPRDERESLRLEQLVPRASRVTLVARAVDRAMLREVTSMGVECVPLGRTTIPTLLRGRRGAYDAVLLQQGASRATTRSVRKWQPHAQVVHAAAGLDVLLNRISSN